LAQILALLSLLKKLMLKELGSLSSVRFNNFLFCILFLMSGGDLKVAFWSTLLFQLVLLAPLLVTFSIDTQHRLPPERVATWPLTGTRRLLLSSVSFCVESIIYSVVFWLPVLDGLSRRSLFCSTGTHRPYDGLRR